LYKEWKINPNAVESSWNSYFQQMEKDEDFVPKFQRKVEKTLSEQTAGTGGYTDKDVQDHIRLMLLIRNYRVRGHLSSDLDPLKLKPVLFQPVRRIFFF
jgi:2-oxoglutarate dehydrogenase complex dehydrogenase (E1) component-like enzyme